MEIIEQELIMRLKEKDPTALELLMYAYGSHVYHLTSRILEGIGTNEDIEECVSDVFVSVWNKLDDYDPNRGTLLTWIYMQTKFCALDCRRKLSNGPQFELIEMDFKNSDDTENSVILKAETEEILRLVDTLHPLDRSIFHKKYFLYESLESIARDLDLTRKAVENRLRRTRMALKQLLDPERKEELFYESEK